MVVKPSLLTVSQLAPLLIHEYERYLPTAFDESLSILQKMNKTIQRLDQLGLLTNGIIEKWNEVIAWVIGTGLEDTVNAKMLEWFNDGTLATIINEQIFSDLNLALLQTKKRIQDTISIDEYESLVITDVNGNKDWTVAFQTAHDNAQRRVLFPNKGLSYRLKKVYIRKDIEIDLQGNKLVGLENAIFCQAEHTDYLHLHGCGGVSFIGAIGGTQGREFYVNYSKAGVWGENTTSFPQGELVEYSVKKLKLDDNITDYAKITVMGDDTVLRYKYNEASNPSTIRPAPYFLYVKKGTNVDGTPSMKSKLDIEKNVWNVYPVDGSNVDIVKITGGIKNAIFSKNHVENNNKLCAAQVDLYTGAHMASIDGNKFRNVQIHRKQVLGSSASAPVNYSMDSITNNVTHLEDGHLQVNAFYLVGSLFTVIGNRVKCDNTNALDKVGFYMENSSTQVGQFNADSSTAFIIALNIVDFTGSLGNGYFMRHGAGAISGNPNSAIEALNVMVGGTRFMYGQIDNVVAVGNMWKDSGRASGTSFGNSAKAGIYVGNIADTDKPIIAGREGGNHATMSYPTISVVGTGVAIDVEGRSTVYVADGGRIESFINGRVGQEIKLMGGIGGATIRFNTFIKTKGSVDFIMPNRGSITLKMGTDSVWIEQARNDATVVVV